MLIVDASVDDMSGMKDLEVIRMAGFVCFLLSVDWSVCSSVALFVELVLVVLKRSGEKALAGTTRAGYQDRGNSEGKVGEAEMTMEEEMREEEGRQATR